jgi:lysophospholipase L1-like esterase
VRRLGAALVGALVLAGTAHAAVPSSIAVLGDSDSTGYNSATPARDAKENSWTTGTNPAVQSLYLRLLAVNPKIRNRNANWAKDGAAAADMLIQAQSALSTKPDLVVIAVGGNDFCIDHVTPIATFRAQLARALTVLSHGLPNARLFVASVAFSSQALQAIAAIPEARQANSPGGECDPHWDANGNPDPAQLAAIDQLLTRYDGVLAAVCAQFVHCRYDGGALTKLIADPTDFSSDWGHPSVTGLAKLAETEWTVLEPMLADTTAPVSTASVRTTRGVRVVTLTARDEVGVAGIEYKLGANKIWLRYRTAIHVPRRTSLTWRAVDVDGSSETPHTLAATR